MNAPYLPTNGHGRPLRLLVGDDDADNVDSLAWVLRLAGHEVFTARAAQAALDSTAANQPDAVVLDLALPNMDGWQVARKLRAQHLGVKPLLIVALTGWGREEDHRRSQDAGIDFHVLKPVEPAELMALLQKARPGAAT